MRSVIDPVVYAIDDGELRDRWYEFAHRREAYDARGGRRFRLRWAERVIVGFGAAKVYVHNAPHPHSGAHCSPQEESA